MNEQHLGDRVSGYVDDELVADERAVAEQHLAQCAPCRDMVHSERLLRAMLRSLPLAEPREGFLDAVLAHGPRDRPAEQRRLRRGLANVAACAAAWVFVVVGVGHLSSTSTVESRVGTYLRVHQASIAQSDGQERPTMVADGGMPSVAASYSLVAVVDDGSLVRAVYSDGPDTVSVFRQTGGLDWETLEAEPDAERARIGPSAAVVIVRGGVEALLFERGAYSYAVVADPTTGVIDQLAVVLPTSPDPSVWDRTKQASRGLLDCFGFRG